MAKKIEVEDDRLKVVRKMTEEYEQESKQLQQLQQQLEQTQEALNQIQGSINKTANVLQLEIDNLREVYSAPEEKYEIDLDKGVFIPKEASAPNMDEVMPDKVMEESADADTPTDIKDSDTEEVKENG